MASLLTSGEPPTGTTRLADRLDANADGLGPPVGIGTAAELPGVVAIGTALL